MSTALCSVSETWIFAIEDVLAGEVALVEPPGRAHREQAADLDRHRDLAEHPLHALVLVQFLPEALALAHVVGGDRHRALRHAEPAHAVREPRRSEADLRRLQPLADFHQALLVRDHEVVEAQLAVSRRAPRGP